MSSANIINLYKVKDIQRWLEDPNNVYIGREAKKLTGSKWGNPHLMRNGVSREETVSRYEEHLNENVDLANSVHELYGKTLGCWCSPQRCHGEILHRRAGNPVVYQTEQNTETSDEIQTTLPQSDRQVVDTALLDDQVTCALKAMNDILANIGQDISYDTSDDHVPIPLNNVETPSSFSTEETNKMYETLLESNSSMDNSRSKVFSDTTARTFSSKSDDSITNRERFEMECKLRSWRASQSKSYNTSRCSSPLPDTRRIQSAPTSPEKDSPETVAAAETMDDDLVNPPNSFSYISSTSSDPKFLDLLEQRNATDDTSKVLNFLAEKLDILSVNINTLQFNHTKLSESVRVSLDETIPVTVRSVEESMHYKIGDLENKFDNYKKMVDIEHKKLQSENADLKESLDSYIAEETDREERIRECISSPPNTLNCLADLAPLREEILKELNDIDIRLIECEQYSRRESLVISGIPDRISNNQSQLQQKVIEILSLIGVNLIYDDISACHRLYNPPDSQFPAKVIVRFINRKIVNFCLEHRDDLQQKAYQHLRLNLRFFESLCAKNEESLRICNQLKREHKIHNHFLRNGFVKMVVEENGRPKKIKHPATLRKMFPGIPENI